MHVDESGLTVNTLTYVPEAADDGRELTCQALLQLQDRHHHHHHDHHEHQADDDGHDGGHDLAAVASVVPHQDSIRLDVHCEYIVRVEGRTDGRMDG